MWDKKGLQGLYALWGTLPTQAKHLEGQHDQSDHAGGGGGGASTAPQPKHTPLAGQADRAGGQASKPKNKPKVNLSDAAPERFNPMKLPNINIKHERGDGRSVRGNSGHKIDEHSSEGSQHYQARRALEDTVQKRGGHISYMNESPLGMEIRSLGVDDASNYVGRGVNWSAAYDALNHDINRKY